MDPAAATALQSSGTSSHRSGQISGRRAGGREGLELACRRDAAGVVVESARDTSMPIGTSKTPGRFTSPLMPTNFIPAAPLLPCALNQSTPRDQDRRWRR